MRDAVIPENGHVVNRASPGEFAMPDVNVTYEQMESAAQQLTAGHDEITSQLSRLKALVDQLVTDGFVTDVASKTFEEAYIEFNNGVTATLEGLGVMSQYLTTAAQRFREVDSSTTIRVD
jgi:WXG100 family type VII secretion target